MMNSISSILYIPITTLVIPTYHSVLEILHIIHGNFKPILRYITVSLLLFAFISSLGYYQQTIRYLAWIALGIASSAGLGFGAHTFVLFLAPHIAAVTLAAHSCQSLNFPEPPYPNEVICPNTTDDEPVTFLKIFLKVAIESFMWGLGTAIGELPPYLAARFHAETRGRALSGGDSLESKSGAGGWLSKCEEWMVMVIKKIGFIGILLCAAIPNPLFDAAGLASGSAQIPFLSFFGATFIGKAIIKVSLQSSFVILAFHNKNLDHLIGRLDNKLGELFPPSKDLNISGRMSQLLEEQRTNVLKKRMGEPTQSSTISVLANWVIIAVFAIFIVSLIRNLDNRYRERKSNVIKKTE